MKGFFKGFKNIFASKEQEQEMVIGHPTDVKHVAHIGWDGSSSAAAPSWMGSFKQSSDFSLKSLSNMPQSSDDGWSKDADRSGQTARSPSTAAYDTASDAPSKRPKKGRRKKAKNSSQSSSTRPSSRSSKFTGSCASAADEVRGVQTYIGIV